LIVSFGEDLHKWVVSLPINLPPFDSAHKEREREREREREIQREREIHRERQRDRERSWEEGQRKKEKLYLVTRNSKKFLEILHLSRIMLATMLHCIVALSCSLAPSLVKHWQKFPSVFIGCLMQQKISSAEECRAF
jgi:hypothetical protein